MMAEFRKFLVALGVAVGVAVTAVADGAVNQSEWFAIAAAFLGSYGVYRVPNAEPVEEV